MSQRNKAKSALSVAPGVEQPPSVNPNALKRAKAVVKQPHTLNEYFEGIQQGNVATLSKAITLVESSLLQHQELAQRLVELCLPVSGKSVRIGITGVPGAGKSTFIEALGTYITGTDKKLAVLAVDPSSERSKGSILGDKTRMELLSANPRAFIRPSPSAGSLGGVARKTRETIILCEAAGYDTIFIETVGVGQSETLVHSMVDFFLLLMLAGAGDELQGIKRGIMEMADMIAITKADGQNLQKANLAQAQYLNVLHLFPMPESDWPPKVFTCSALNNVGIDDIWENILDYVSLTQSSGFFQKRRISQATYWMNQTIEETLKNRFYSNPAVASELARLQNEVKGGRMGPFVAAQKAIDYFESI